VNVTRDINEVLDVNGYVFEPSPSGLDPGIRIRTFDNEYYVDIPWTTDYIAGSGSGPSTTDEEPPNLGDASF
jgi:hypothetical protein